MFLLGGLFLIRTTSQKMFLIRTLHIKYMEKYFFLVNKLFWIWTWKFWHTSGTKNVPYHSRSYNSTVEIFSISYNQVITILKITRLFLLGPLCLIRTSSENMILIRTVYLNYIEKNVFLVNKLFPCLNLKIPSCARI